MTSFRNLIEPIVIISLFVVGALINRRRGSKQQYSDIETAQLYVDESSGYDSSTSSSSLSSPPLKPVRGYDEGGAGMLWEVLGTFWRKYPFLPEIWYWNLTYWVYQLLRALSARMIAGHPAIFDLAREHAISILSFERVFGFDVELGLQRYILETHPDLMSILARIYYSHISVGVAFIVYAYTYTPYHIYKRVRHTLALDNAIAFVVITVWRCSPPRLLPPAYGYIDVLHASHGTLGSAWTQNKFQLTIAAMPSLHFGTSLLLAVYLMRFAPHRVVRYGAVLWPMAMLVTILATANHFVTDALVGAMIPYLGWRFGWVIGKLGCLETWVFAGLRRKLDLDEDGNEMRRIID